MKKFKYLFLIMLLTCFTISCGITKDTLNKDKVSNMTADETEKLYVRQNANYAEYADADELTNKST